MQGEGLPPKSLSAAGFPSLVSPCDNLETSAPPKSLLVGHAPPTQTARKARRQSQTIEQF
jgi:hypothetical protein